MTDSDDIKYLIKKNNKEMQRLINSARSTAEEMGTRRAEFPIPESDEKAFESIFIFNTDRSNRNDENAPALAANGNIMNDAPPTPQPMDQPIQPTPPPAPSPTPPENPPANMPEQPTVPAPQPTPTEAPNFTMPPPTSSGTLTVLTTSAKGTVPVSDATVIISEADSNGNEHLLYTLTTNRDGETIPVNLATYPIELSQNPDFYGSPYKTYRIVVTKDGYFTSVFKNVPIFADRNATQPVNMIPLPENFSGDTIRVYSEPEVQTAPRINTPPQKEA